MKRSRTCKSTSRKLKLRRTLTRYLKPFGRGTLCDSSHSLDAGCLRRAKSQARRMHMRHCAEECTDVCIASYTAGAKHCLDRAAIHCTDRAQLAKQLRARPAAQQAKFTTAFRTATDSHRKHEPGCLAICEHVTKRNLLTRSSQPAVSARRLSAQPRSCDPVGGGVSPTSSVLPAAAPKCASSPSPWLQLSASVEVCSTHSYSGHPQRRRCSR